MRTRRVTTGPLGIESFRVKQDLDGRVVSITVSEPDNGGYNPDTNTISYIVAMRFYNKRRMTHDEVMREWSEMHQEL